MNPLKKLHKTMTWQEMANRTGISRQQIMTISNFEEKNVLMMRVGTLLILMEKLDTCLLDMVKEYK